MFSQPQDDGKPHSVALTPSSANNNYLITYVETLAILWDDIQFKKFATLNYTEVDSTLNHSFFCVCKTLVLFFHVKKIVLIEWLLLI